MSAPDPYRRTLLRAAALSPLAGLVPAWARAADGITRRLLLIELNGGNDGLNTLVPYADPAYHRVRPTLAVARDQALALDEYTGLNPALKPLMPAWDARELAIVQGLGYGQPNRSHFRSIEIWDTASGAERVASDGWITRVGSTASLGRAFAADAVVIGRNPGPVAGGALQVLVIEDARSFVAEAASIRRGTADGQTAALRHILSVQRDIERGATGLAGARAAAPGRFPGTPFGKDMAEAARLLAGTPATPVVKLALPGFDHHANQRIAHDKLLAQLADCLAAFRASMTEAGVWKHTLVMTYSEFGRRATENASRGTDHGAAAPHLVMGGAVRGGLYGQRPDFAALVNGDIRVSTDYRCLYNTVLGRWWNLAGAQIDPTRYPALALV